MQRKTKRQGGREGRKPRRYPTTDSCALPSSEQSNTGRVQAGAWGPAVRNIAEETDKLDDHKGHFQFSEAMIPTVCPAQNFIPFPHQGQCGAPNPMNTCQNLVCVMHIQQ